MIIVIWMLLLVAWLLWPGSILIIFILDGFCTNLWLGTTLWHSVRCHIRIVYTWSTMLTYVGQQQQLEDGADLDIYSTWPRVSAIYMRNFPACRWFCHFNMHFFRGCPVVPWLISTSKDSLFGHGLWINIQDRWHKLPPRNVVKTPMQR